MTSRGSHGYCVVYGCLNCSVYKPDVSFFKLPANVERRSKWLRLICREDLADKAPQNYTVCAEHFDPLDILPGRQRKKLKTNSLPSRNLPDVQKIEEKPSGKGKVSKLVERCVQTEETTALLASGDIQTFITVSSDTRSKRKRKSGPSSNKKIKLHEIEIETEENQRETFHKLCDRFLTKELAVLVKAHNDLKFHNTGNSNDQNYKIFCLKLHHTSPQAYRVLQNAICLPCPNMLIKNETVTTEISDTLMSMLKIKVEAMTDAEKNCSVVIDAVSLKANLLYNVKQDKIIGFQEINGVQSPEPATNALVVMVRGISVNWQQLVGFALLSDCSISDEVSKWIDKLLEKLFEIGLNIRTFVSDLGSGLLDAAEKRSVTIEQPYFFVNNRKIYYIFDAPHLLKLVRNNLIVYDFHFQDRVAKYEHIVQFYDNDTQKSFKLAPKLANSHIRPSDADRTKVRYATQLLSHSVAAGLSAYIDFNVIEESGRDTVEFIKNINNLFDALNTSNQKDNYEYKRAFCGKQAQINFFNEMLNFFQHLKLIDPANGKDVTSNAKFIKGFQITMKSILLLFDDLKSEGCTFLLTKRLNQDEFENLFGQLRTKKGLATEPTSWQFISAYQKQFCSNLIKPTKQDNCVNDLGKLLTQTDTVTNCQLSYEVPIKVEKGSPCPSDEDPDTNIEIISSEYNQLDLPEEHALFDVCVYLLKKCAERHECEILKSYIKSNQASADFSTERQYHRYRDYSEQTNSSLLVVPSDDFIEYIEEIDEIFRNCLQREHVNSKIAASIYKEIEEIGFLVPCPCFPMVYLIKLFIRMRIFYTVKLNNRAFRTSCGNRKCFTVNNL